MDHANKLSVSVICIKSLGLQNGENGLKKKKKKHFVKIVTSLVSFIKSKMFIIYFLFTKKKPLF